jgi:hypothetical protein
MRGEAGGVWYCIRKAAKNDTQIQTLDKMESALVAIVAIG